MDQGTHQFLCQAQTRRLVLLLGITVAIVLLVQYVELPYPTVLSSLFLTRGSSSTSETNGNKEISKGLNSIYVDIGQASSDTETDEGNNLSGSPRDPKVNSDSASSKGKNDFPLVIKDSSHVDLDKSSMSKNENISANGPATVKARQSEYDISLKNDTEDTNSSSSSIQPEDLAPTDSDSSARYLKPEDMASNETISSSSSIQPEEVVLPEESNGNLQALSPSSLPKKTIPPYKVTESRSPVISADTANRTSENKYTAGKKKRGERAASLKSSRSKSKKKSSTNVSKDKNSKKPKSVVPISEMNKLLLQSLAGSNKMVTNWLAPVDQEVLFAKSQIENAPITKNDEILHSPIFRNLSMFKRSYELMENMLKVYIYQEGEKPIFHEPILEGIYASEGWFMKLLEANKNFITKDPAKAHLFYFPYSSQMLKIQIYVPNSHKRANVIKYMKDYVDMIAAKYSFWNRTNGADHFLAACHDWAPAETRGRMLSCIRALCNADLEAGFKIGKDVSLPETYVHSKKNPIKYLGGNPPSQRHILAFFAGRMHGYVRPILLEYWENKDSDMKIFGQLTGVNNRTDYFHYMKSSKYCICARGYEVNSPRVVEAIFYDCVPVIISDNYVPAFFEILNWESFAVFVLEKDIPNLKNILLSISEERYMEMYMGVKKVQQHFLWHDQPVKYDLFHMILHNVWYNRVFRTRPT
uniref:probable glycosyltransferase At3g07620 n=1 Tax=Ziziphus jujuba TaxID=326968 RepID=A0A6P3ZUR8_ZIZJJ